MGSETIDALTNALNEAISAYTHDYEPLAPSDRAKAIHDAVWGTHIFSPAEIALIDSPLLQRLRFIHQTALAFYTYPSANHSRFEHTLGTTVITTKMVQSLNLKGRWITPIEIQELRVAALLHDCGQGLFSHISEDFYKNHPWIKKLKKEPRYESAKAHELLSHFIMKTKEFRDLFHKIQAKYNSDNIFRSIDDLDKVANLILGVGPEDKPYLGKIINGPFDADKLDYINRDAYFTGLRLNVDIERLLYALDVQKVEGRECIGGSFSGASAFEQVLLSKIQLYSCLYYHPKVRAADMMFNSFLRYMHDHWQQLREADEKKGRVTVRFDVPSDYLKYADFDFLNPHLHEDPYLLAIVNRFRQRKLPVKALVICDRSVCKGLRTLLRAAEQDDWESRRWGLQREICEAIKANIRPTPYDIIVDIPELPPLNEAELTYLFLKPGTEPTIRLSEFFPTSHPWLGTYIQNKWRGHVFCPSEPPELQREVGKCALDVLESKFPELKFNKYATELANYRQ